MRRLLIAAACCGGVALGPALALAQSPGATMQANDGPPENWQANGVAGQTAVTIAPGQSVTFANGASEFHNLDFSTATAQCPNIPMSGGRPGWSETCTFTTPGTYDFHCDFHPWMVGQVVVQGPAATPTPVGTPTPTPVATAVPAATPSPTPAPGKLTVSLARHQRGTRVRGSARVSPAGSRLTVTLRAHGSSAGRWTSARLGSGTAHFSVPVSLRARRARPVAITVTVVLTPPGGKALARRQGVTLRQ